MRIMGILKQKKGNIPIWGWIIFGMIPLFFFCIYTYTDIRVTTEDGIAVWYAIFDEKSLGKYYMMLYPYRDGGYPSYDFFIYLIFAIWDFPLYIYEKIAKTGFSQNYVLLLYAKSICLFFLVLCASQIYKIVHKITNDKEKAWWGCFTFVFSVTVFQAVVIICGYDVISLFFTLCGIHAYLEEKDKKFILCFSCAIACKMFALWVFIPLLLLKYKRIWKVAAGFLAGVALMVLPKLYFMFYQKISGLKILSDKDSTLVSANAVRYISDYLWSSEAPIATIYIPWLFFFTFILWVWCWFNKKKLSDKMVIYICLIGMSIFMLTCYTHPQWMILIMPYIAILECSGWTNLPESLFCEVCMGAGHILWMVRNAPQCYSYNIINNMLHLEEGNREFWYTGIWLYISKLSNMVHISMDNIFLMFRSIFVASFILLLIYVYPREKQQEPVAESKEVKRLFYLKAMVSMLVLGIPLLGAILRMMGLQ